MTLTPPLSDDDDDKSDDEEDDNDENDDDADDDDNDDDAADDDDNDDMTLTSLRRIDRFPMWQSFEEQARGEIQNPSFDQRVPRLKGETPRTVLRSIHALP